MGLFAKYITAEEARAARIAEATDNKVAMTNQKIAEAHAIEFEIEKHLIPYFLQHLPPKMHGSFAQKIALLPPLSEDAPQLTPVQEDALNKLTDQLTSLSRELKFYLSNLNIEGRLCSDDIRFCEQVTTKVGLHIVEALNPALDKRDREKHAQAIQTYAEKLPQNAGMERRRIIKNTLTAIVGLVSFCIGIALLIPKPPLGFLALAAGVTLMVRGVYRAYKDTKKDHSSVNLQVGRVAAGLTQAISKGAIIQPQVEKVIEENGSQKLPGPNRR